MKKGLLAAGVALSIFVAPSFSAEMVECFSDNRFGDIDCDVCYRSEAFSAKHDGSNYETTITNVQFQWENTSDTYHELVYQGEQEAPTIQSNLSYTLDPTDETTFWQYGEQVLWTEYLGVHEFYTEPGTSLVFRKMNGNASINIKQESAPSDPGFVLISSKLIYRDFDVESFEESDSQVRNHCEIIDVPFDEMVESHTVTTTSNDNQTGNIDVNTSGNETDVSVTTTVTDTNPTTDQNLNIQTDDTNVVLNSAGDESQHTGTISVQSGDSSTTVTMTQSGDTDSIDIENDNTQVEVQTQTYDAAGPTQGITTQQTQTQSGPEHALLIGLAAVASYIFLRRRKHA